eukprot:CAMPEP_0206152686 /NCGR_PEP_ID=MMETSP1473-20131121/39454_1 /ASSEMBLY_ACC=CAM_ASM_001109 /TAXON_ID=1461547 /ORGANISM="Stichococcus sp, Strain RCC1054" /LENGTH=573 /DNA_ID=CAMNT_0053550251 /DNA_START=115 /DNA_END=1835 /DNA_ORIENTATION=-
MVKRKPFIDKKKATTFNLLYRASEVQIDGEDEGPERELVDVNRRVGIGRVDEEAAAASTSGGGRYPPGHPLAWLQDPVRDNLTAERRAELLGMGFPDDGYDYLKHMRAPGRGGRANLEGASEADTFAGPSMFIPAENTSAHLRDDTRIFDASGLTIHQPADDEDSATQASGGVTAFSQQRARLRGADAGEVAELEALMEQMEDAEGGDVALEDDFIISATQAPEQQEAEVDQHGSGPTGTGSQAGQLIWPGDEDSGASESGSEASSQSEWDEDVSRAGGGREGGAASRMDARPGSIASTYWRPERSDRKNLLSTVDERFEHLALDYDEDDIGNLSEDEAAAQGPAELDSYGTLLDDFLANAETGLPVDPSEARPHGMAYRNAADLAKAGRSGEEAASAARAVSQAKSLMRGSGGGEAGGGPSGESVLSLRSNLDNHPASIMEPQSSRRPRRQVLDAGPDLSGGFIKLGRDTGIPLGVVGSRRAADRAAARGGADGESVSDDGYSSGGEGGFMPAPRLKGETAEEKRARKNEVKEAKRAARVAKKEMKGMYKKEFARQTKAMAAPAPTIIPLNG